MIISEETNISTIFSNLNNKAGVYGINTLTSFNQINTIGFWKISEIDNNYAQSVGITINPGDYTALVVNCNHKGNMFQFGNILLSSPRLGTNVYSIQIWDGAVQTALIGDSNRLGNLTFTVMSIGIMPDNTDVPNYFDFPEGFSAGNSFVMAVRVVRGNTFIYSNDGKACNIIFEGDRISVYATEYGITYCQNAPISCVLAKLG